MHLHSIYRGAHRSVHRIVPTTAALALTAALLMGCTATGSSADQETPSSSSSSTTGQAASTTSDRPMTVAAAMEQNHGYWTPDDAGEGEGEPATTIALDGKSATTDSSDVKVDGATVTITAAGTYELTGTLQGQVVVDASDDAQVKLVLKDAGISNSDGPALLLTNADGVVVELAEGTQNKISDTATFAEDADENGALFSHVDLVITGGGSLDVSGGGEDGIVSKDDLVIMGGTITVDATDDGIRGKDALVITGGTIDVTAGGDGMKTTNEDEADRGYFLITGGNVTIAAGSDGIDSAQDALFDGGTVLISKSDEGVEAQNLIIGDGVLDITSTDDGLNATVGSSSATTATTTAGGPMGDVDDGSNLVIYGGIVTINAEGDGIDSNGALTISGGKVTVFGTSRGGNGAFDSNGTFTLSGGEVLALSAGQMEQGPSVVSQALVEASVSGATGESVTVSAGGQTLAQVQAVKGFGYVLYSSPELSEGTAVSVAAGTNAVEATAALTSSNGMGMGPGGPGGRPGEGGAGEMPDGFPGDGPGNEIGEGPGGRPGEGGPGAPGEGPGGRPGAPGDGTGGMPGEAPGQGATPSEDA